MRPIDADVLKQHIDKLPALPDGNFAGNHSALKALINMQPTIEPSTNCSEFPNNSDTVSRQQAIDIVVFECGKWTGLAKEISKQLKQLPPAQPEYRLDEWCMDCKEYDQEKHCCPRFNRVIREAAEEVRQNAQPEPAIPLSWIENEIKWLKSLDNTFSEITTLQISAMVKKWRDEQNE